MTHLQKARFARIVADLAALRDECDAADRFELGVLILETAGPLSRPCDEPLLPDEQCREHGCSLWRCGEAHGQTDPAIDPYDGTR